MKIEDRDQIAQKVYADMQRHARNAAVKRRQPVDRVENMIDAAVSIARDEAKIEALADVYESLTGANSFDTAHDAKRGAKAPA